MFRQNSPAELAKWLDMYRATHVCCYSSFVPDPSGSGNWKIVPNTYCDCKYGVDPEKAYESRANGSEQTGCPELREIIEELHRMEGLEK